MKQGQEKDLQERDFAEVKSEGIKKKKRSRKTIGEEGSRKQTAIGLMLTILLSLAFYLPVEVKLWWKNFNKTETITIEKPVGDSKDISQLMGFKVEIRKKQDAENIVTRLTKDLSGNYGIFVKKLGKEARFWGVNDKREFTAASVIKLPLLLAYYQAIDRGEIDPQDIYILKEKDRFKYGSGQMQNQAEGTKYSYRKIAFLVANQSDNMGAKIMAGWLGGEKQVDKVIKSWGLEQTSIVKGITTPREIGELLEMVYKGNLLKKKSKQELFANLIDTANEDRLPAGVPTGVKVVHKFGSETGVVNDCGLVEPGDLKIDPYVICILSDQVNDGQAEEVLPKIGRIVWEWASQSD